MASEVSYTITRSNNQTEKRAINYLLEKDRCLWQLESEDRKKIMQYCGIDKKFSRAFDLVRVDGTNNLDTLTLHPETKIIFIELKTTQKYLPNFPKGFFFGATENEFRLAQILGERYEFYFVSLHEDSFEYCAMTLQEVEVFIRNKRVQYQINF